MNLIKNRYQVDVRKIVIFGAGKIGRSFIGQLFGSGGYKVVFVDAPGVVLTGMKKAEDGNELIVRLSEIEGKETTINLRLPVDVSVARRLNLIELSLENTSKPPR